MYYKKYKTKLSKYMQTAIAKATNIQQKIMLKQLILKKEVTSHIKKF